MRGISLVALACLVACSSDDTTPYHGTDASFDAAADASLDATADAPQEAGSDSGSAACNELSNIGTVVPQTFVATDAVSGAGGLLVAGTYVLTAAVVYTGPGGGTGPTGLKLRDTLIIDASNLYQRVTSIVDDAGVDGSPLHENGAFVVDGSSIQVTQTCPPGVQPFTSYDSNGTTIHIYASAAGGSPAVMFEYTRQ